MSLAFYIIYKNKKISFFSKIVKKKRFQNIENYKFYLYRSIKK